MSNNQYKAPFKERNYHCDISGPDLPRNFYDEWNKAFRAWEERRGLAEKRGGFHFGTKDVFVNIAGGLKVEDPALDLAIATALLSSFEDNPLPNNMVFAGEVGLSGEIRAVTRIEQRIAEAEKLGFEKIVISKYCKRQKETKTPDIEVISLGRIDELYKLLF